MPATLCPSALLLLQVKKITKHCRVAKARKNGGMEPSRTPGATTRPRQSKGPCPDVFLYHRVTTNSNSMTQLSDDFIWASSSREDVQGKGARYRVALPCAAGV
jgi:hypothetical protein